MPDRYYLDTSAYLAILLGEEVGADLDKRTAGAELLSSVLIVLEATRSLVRLTRQGGITPTKHVSAITRLRADLEEFDLRDVDLEICNSPIFPAVNLPRSFDLAHLRTALEYHEERPLTAFLSLDKSQLRAARDLGLPT